jgi:SAM-dependent methyltransferase
MILDVGCGGGRTIGKLTAAAPQACVFGVDYSADCVGGGVATCRRHVRPRDRDRDATTTGPISSTTSAVARALKPGGQLLIVAEAYAVGWYGPLHKVVMAPMGGRVLTAAEQRAACSAAGYVDIDVREDRRRGWLTIAGRRSLQTVPALT